MVHGIVELYRYGDLLETTFVIQALLVVCYLISSFILLHNSYAGFIALFKGLLFSFFIFLSYYGLRKHPNKTWYGVILGGATLLVFISLENAIFWGQYSLCDDSEINKDEMNIENGGSIFVECSNTDAMKSLCVFSVFLFLSYIFLLALLFRFKNDILNSNQLNEGYSNNEYPRNQSYDPVHNYENTRGILHSTDL